MYIADQGLSQNNMAAAAAMSYVLFAFLAIISIVNFRLQRERVREERLMTTTTAPEKPAAPTAVRARRKQTPPARGSQDRALRAC